MENNVLYYFAYGSNMCLRQMEERCGKENFTLIGRAKLQGYRFVYDGYSKSRNGAVANILKDERCNVEGVLYKINLKALDMLDRYEGYPRTYQRKEVLVHRNNGKQYRAWVYYRTEQQPGRPSTEYRQVVIQGAHENGLSDDYIRRYLAEFEP